MRELHLSLASVVSRFTHNTKRSSRNCARRIRFEALEPRHMMAYLAGDFNLSGVVDQTDYNVWKANFGNVGESPVDGNGDFVVDAADYTVWRDNLGKTLADVAPDAPRVVEARAVGATSIQINWQAASNTTSYAVQRRQPGTETEFTTIAPSVGTTTYTDNTATTDTLYEYRAVAQNANGSSPASQTAQATANQSGLTAYRPQGVQDFENPTNGPLYDRFPRTPVPDENENSSTLGPGIRINADDDNQNGISDRAEMGTAIPQENDLIEVKIDRLPGSGNLVLSAGFKLLMYKDHNKDTPFNSNTPIDFVNNSGTIFVEWVDSNHGTETLTLIDQATMTPLDTIRFHSFRSIVVVFGGANQDPTDEDGDGSIGDPIGGVLSGGNANREGIFDVATNLYVQGWDVYPYEEDEVDDAEDLPFIEITNAIDRRFVGFNFDTGVGGIAIMGFSQGGGAVHDLIERLWDERDIITDFGMYLDAVEHDLPEPTLPETRWPEGCFSLLNIYQRLGPFVGDQIDEDTELGFLEEYNVTDDPGWDETDNHFSIDDDIQVKAAIRQRLEEHLLTR